jgi:hypothetical protein
MFSEREWWDQIEWSQHAFEYLQQLEYGNTFQSATWTALLHRTDSQLLDTGNLSQEAVRYITLSNTYESR